MDRSIAAILAGRESPQNWKHWLSELRGKFRMGYDRIVGALANLGHRVSDQTVGLLRGRIQLLAEMLKGQSA